MNILTLNGTWQLSKAGEAATIPATVPGCVHTDLLAAGKIDDPYYRDNELALQWIGETDWVYHRAFTLPEDFLAHDRVLLHCEGLDTLATITLNGVPIATTDNMFRTWEFDVKATLKPGENTITVAFTAAVPYVRTKQAERLLPPRESDHKIPGGNWLRKEQCNFGWDWGPKLVTCGIWQAISLVAFDTARLSDVYIAQNHAHPEGVGLTIHTTAELAHSANLSAAISVNFKGQVVAKAITPVIESRATTELVITNPALWWPNGMGDHPLYDVRVNLLDADGTILDTMTKRIGLRTLTLERRKDEWGESFVFEINGIPFFAKGANWIPADTFATRITYEDYRRLIADAAAVNMNMLRVWGGGLYEHDHFYDLCDEMGICVWQDFTFACATYPTFDDNFLKNVRAEAEDNVRRIRHHASLALWCGNNELEQGMVGEAWTEYTMSWADYDRLFNDILPEVVRELDPQRDYWPSSPHTSGGKRTNWKHPDYGDSHLWEVWHGWEPFEWYRTANHRFVSEFGFQSFPEPQTTYTYTLPEDRNVTSFVMEHHQRSKIGNITIIRYMLDWFRLPTSFDMTLWLSQILQGLGIKYAVEHWRRIMPRNMGAIYWQLNDCWQVASWASIDYLGRWKALHYMARQFFAPLLISGVEDPEAGTVEIHVSSNRLDEVEGQIIWTLTDCDGNTIDSGQDTATIPAGRSTLVQTLDLSPAVAAHHTRDLLLWLALGADGEVVSRNFVTFVRPKHLNLQAPDIQTNIEPLADGRHRVRLSTDVPAVWVWLEVQENISRLSDNFFHLRPGEPRDVIVSADTPLSSEQLAERLIVRSLVDTYRPCP